METILLDDIRFEPDVEALLTRLRLDPEGDDAARVSSLAEAARDLARPKALYRPAYVEARGEDTVVVDRITLASRVLRVNLDGVHRVFPYVATCGRELEAWAATIEDWLEGYWAGAIMEMALRSATRALLADLEARFGPGETSAMNPGSLADWPLPQQRELFALLGDVRGAIGVELTESFLMVPVKSVSGLRFPTEVRYENCQLCPREGCPGRRAPYDAGLYERRYGGQGDGNRKGRKERQGDAKREGNHKGLKEHKGA